MRLVVEPGPLQVMIGTSSEDTPLAATFAIVGEPVQVERKGAFFSKAEVI